jgi:hypothetical protein
MALGEKILKNPTGLRNRWAGIIIDPCYLLLMEDEKVSWSGSFTG